MKNLVVTTSSDLSIPELGKFADVFLLDKDDYGGGLVSKYDTLYIRSQFNRPELMPQVFESEIDTIGREARDHGLYIVDDTYSLQQILDFEDKWLQYKKLAKFMPETELLSETDGADGQFLYKKRLSSRATGIVWQVEDIYGEKSDWIRQDRQDIRQELRVFVVCGQVCPTASIRSSKTENTEVKVAGFRELDSEELEFAMRVAESIPEIDFAGLDIIITEGGLKLIEVNRSPIFSSFTRDTGVNLASELYRGIER